MAEDVLHRLRVPRAGRDRVVRRCAITCSPTPPTGPMPPCAASSAAWGPTCWTTSSRCAPPTTRPPAPASRRPAAGRARAAGRGRCWPATRWRQSQLAIDGNDLVAELGMSAGAADRRAAAPARWRPSWTTRRRTREQLLTLARAAVEPCASEHRQDGDGGPPRGGSEARCYNRRSWGSAHLALRPSPTRMDLRTLTAIGRRAARLEHRLTRANASLAELDAAVGARRRARLAALDRQPVAGQGGEARAGPRADPAGHHRRLRQRQPDPGRQGLRGEQGAGAGREPDRLRAERRRPALRRRRDRLQRHAGRGRHGPFGPGRGRRDRRGRADER